MNTDTICSEIVALPALEVLEADWRALEKHCNGSFFTSWGFIGPIIKQTRRPPALFIARQAGTIVALALIAQTSRKTRFGPVPGLSINQTGVPEEDLVYIEFNDILCPETIRPLVLTSLAAALDKHAAPWSELHLAGFAADRTGDIATATNLPLSVDKTSPAPFVDLEKVRASGYPALLSRNTRSQIARSKRLFEDAHGPLTLRQVTDRAQITAEVSTLATLQIERFGKTPTPSSFNTPAFRAFVEALLLEPPGPNTRAELLKVEAGATLLGLLVNLTHGHHNQTAVVANYQCAFARYSDNRLKPGLVAHGLAISHYAELGNDIYHFLGGHQQYKKSLATGTDDLTWSRLQKPDLRLKLEAALKRLKTNLKAHFVP